MEWIKLPLVQLTFFYALGIVLANHFCIASIALYTSGFGLFSLALLIHYTRRKSTKKSLLFNSCIYVIFILFGIFNYQQKKPAQLTSSSFQSSKTQVFYVSEVLKESQFYARYYGNLQDSLSGFNTKILIRIKKDTACKPLHLGQYYASSLMPSKIPKPKNPNEFDYAEYLFYQGVGSELKGGGNQIKAIFKKHKSLKILALKFRQRLNRTIVANIKNPANTAVLSALLLGEKTGINPTIRNTFANAGVMHVLAISGLHLGIILLFLNKVTARFKRKLWGRIMGLLLSVTVLWSFAFITGLSSSIVRAAVMFSLFALAQVMERKTNSMNVLFLSFLILLLYNPLYLYQVGFKMSYAAVFFIIWIHPLIKKQYVPKSKLARRLWEILSVSFVAQWGVLPISFYYFNVFPSYFLVANLVILPCVGPILGYGLLVLLISAIVPVPEVAFTILEFLIEVITQAATQIGTLPLATIEQIHINSLQLWVLYLLSFALVLVLQYKPKYGFRFISLAAVIFYGLIALKQNKDAVNHNWILHEVGKTAFINKQGRLINLFTNVNPTDTMYLNRLRKTHNAINIIQEQLPQYLVINNCKVLIVSTKTAIPTQILGLDYLVLTNNAKIHLQAWVQQLKPKLIIADGSSYIQNVARWSATAKQEKLPFYNTAQSGAFKF